MIKLLALLTLLLGALCHAESNDTEHQIPPANTIEIDPVSYLGLQGSGPDYSVADVWRTHAHLPNYEAVRAAALDTFQGLPETFEDAYRNPCWIESDPMQPTGATTRTRAPLATAQQTALRNGTTAILSPTAQTARFLSAVSSGRRTRRAVSQAAGGASGTGTLRCLPYFQILGVSKCGTTDLYQRLSRHLDMIDCGYKGPHFWDESTYPDLRKKDPARAGKYDGSFGAYVRIFDKAAAHIQRHPTAITGEASSNTFTAVYSHLRGRTTAKRVDATLADYLAEATPWARFIVLFRDPVTRYYSAYHYYRNRMQGAGTVQEFHVKVLADIASWNSCLERFDMRHCLKVYEPQQLVKGLYAEFMEPWLACFSSNRFLFLRNEDYQTAPKPHLQTVMSFLGLRDLSLVEWSAVIGKARANTQSGRYSKMLPESLTALQAFYRPYNQKLSDAMGGDPRWLWGY
ncbi:MAG: hypothetical protein WDW38_001135 [Sanguina aurantia]